MVLALGDFWYLIIKNKYFISKIGVVITRF